MRIKWLMLLSTFFYVSVFANKEYDVREDGNSYSYVDTLCVTPDIAYNNAQDWIVKSSSSYKSSVQFEDKEQGKIIVKSGTKYPYEKEVNVDSFLTFDMTIELKEGRFRIKLEHIKYHMLIHSVDLGLFETGEDEQELDIVWFSGYDKDVVSGVPFFRDEKEYDNNKLLLQELKSKLSVTNKKKEQNKLNADIKRIENRQNTIDEDREKYKYINSSINGFVALVTKQLNIYDDF